MSEAELEAKGPGGAILRGAREGGGEESEASGGDGVQVPILLAHGLTAHRDLVVHGSRTLARAGHEVIRYDARAHGRSDAGAAGSRTYDVLADDMAAVLEESLSAGPRRPVLAGHSMGAHTIVRLALRDPSAFAGVVVVGPATVGTPPGEESLERWDSLADGLAEGGVEGFLAAYSEGLDPDWSETLIRIARERLGRHRDLEALAAALREVPRSVPFDGLAELASLDVPALIVGSGDEADPGHPYAVAAAYAEALPRATLISEREGESPLAWQGGRLSREIASFCATGAVRERFDID